MSSAGIALRLAILALALAVLIPLQWVAMRVHAGLAGALPVALHRLFLRVFGIRLTVTGTPPARGTPTLVLANHVSWLDIAAMGSLRPLSFIAKQEIAGWPLFGLFAKLQRCIFLDRTRRGATAEVNTVVAERLTAGDAIVLFPEGTTGDGNRLLPFRSSLVGAARAALSGPDSPPIALQPLAIAYTRRWGLPVTRRDRPAVAWYGDMELPAHLSGFARGGPLDIALHWGDPIPFTAATDRKAATAEAEAAVRRALRGQ